MAGAHTVHPQWAATHCTTHGQSLGARHGLVAHLVPDMAWHGGNTYSTHTVSRDTLCNPRTVTWCQTWDGETLGVSHGVQIHSHSHTLTQQATTHHWWSTYPWNNNPADYTCHSTIRRLSKHTRIIPSQKKKRLDWLAPLMEAIMPIQALMLGGSVSVGAQWWLNPLQTYALVGGGEKTRKRGILRSIWSSHKSPKQRLNLSRSRHKGLSHAYSTSFHI